MQINIARKGQLFLLLSFAVLIIIGTALLLLPGILKEGTLSVTDALFMSCSAVCLNGLATVPLTEFSFAGQLVLLVLIQIGTLGIMTLSAMILLLMGKGLSYGDTLLIPIDIFKENNSWVVKESGERNIVSLKIS